MKQIRALVLHVLMMEPASFQASPTLATVHQAPVGSVVKTIPVPLLHAKMEQFVQPTVLDMTVIAPGGIREVRVRSRRALPIRVKTVGHATCWGVTTFALVFKATLG